MNEPTDADTRAIALGGWGETLGELVDAIEGDRLIGVVYMVRKAGGDGDIQVGRAGIGNYDEMIRDALVLSGARDPGTRN